MKRIELYQTPEEAYKAFRSYCTGRFCGTCPYDQGEVDCQFSWSMDEVETIRRVDLYNTPEAAIKDFNKMCPNTITDCSPCKYNIINGGRDVCMAAWLMEKVPRER